MCTATKDLTTPIIEGLEEALVHICTLHMPLSMPPLVFTELYHSNVLYASTTGSRGLLGAQAAISKKLYGDICFTDAHCVRVLTLQIEKVEQH